MKKYQLVNGLSCLAALTGCQNLMPELSAYQRNQPAVLVNQDDITCVVIDDKHCSTNTPLNGTFISYQLQFDTNNNQKADTELAVCADISHLNRKGIQNYITSVKNLSDTGVLSLNQWQQKVQTDPILKGKKIETFFYQIQEEYQRTR